jgi:hypothetical protein
MRIQIFFIIEGCCGCVDREFAGVRVELAKDRGDINPLHWMVGANFALMPAVFVKLFTH